MSCGPAGSGLRSSISWEARLPRALCSSEKAAVEQTAGSRRCMFADVHAVMLDRTARRSSVGDTAYGLVSPADTDMKKKERPAGTVFVGNKTQIVPPLHLVAVPAWFGRLTGVTSRETRYFMPNAAVHLCPSRVFTIGRRHPDPDRGSGGHHGEGG